MLSAHRRSVRSMPADLALELDNDDVIWGGGGAVASLPVDAYGRALSMFVCASMARSCAPPHCGRPPVALGLPDRICT
jgi:hypothetical protein